ncbi:MAG: FemAB family PEP-CTERM system-associated protein [Gemmataceae bacterium]|nr:FemAB family PEP-CTERM system-associated protein [Gemmataceae bacterium]
MVPLPTPTATSAPAPPRLTVALHSGRELLQRLPRLEAYLLRGKQVPLSRHPGWLTALERGLGHTPYCLEAVEGEQTRGFLPLAYVSSWLFGRFLVSLPYLNYGGPVTDDDGTAHLLIDRAVTLADELRVRYLELRNTWAHDHPALGERVSTKMHMRLPLPATCEELWKQLSGKVKNQLRKAQKGELTFAWGRADLLAEFYAVFARNMRDLGTPVYGKGLFRAVLETFSDRAEICVVRLGKRAVAGALLLHGWGVTEVPSASSLRKYNPTNANMLMYWHLLQRAVERRQDVFDFGRSSEGSNTYRFKKQWGASASPAEWQYHLLSGGVGDVRPDNPRYGLMIRLWRWLPVWMTRVLGPRIVRGIP